MGIEAEVKRRPAARKAAAALASINAGTRPRRAQRLDRRSAQTIDKILAAAIAVMLEGGASKLAASTVCRKAGVSRATFYRYYASRQALLNAISTHIRAQTRKLLTDSVADTDTAEARWNALITYPDTGTPQTARLLEMEPSFTLAFIRDGFSGSKARVAEAMGPVFDSWEKQLGGPLKRELLAEMMIRLSISELVLPPAMSRQALMAEFGEMIALLRRGSV